MFQGLYLLQVLLAGLLRLFFETILNYIDQKNLPKLQGYLDMVVLVLADYDTNSILHYYSARFSSSQPESFSSMLIFIKITP